MLVLSERDLLVPVPNPVPRPLLSVGLAAPEKSEPPPAPRPPAPLSPVPKPVPVPSVFVPVPKPVLLPNRPPWVWVPVRDVKVSQQQTRPFERLFLTESDVSRGVKILPKPVLFPKPKPVDAAGLLKRPALCVLVPNRVDAVVVAPNAGLFAPNKPLPPCKKKCEVDFRTVSLTLFLTFFATAADNARHASSPHRLSLSSEATAASAGPEAEAAAGRGRAAEQTSSALTRRCRVTKEPRWLQRVRAHIFNACMT